MMSMWSCYTLKIMPEFQPEEMDYINTIREEVWIYGELLKLYGYCGVALRN